jgi:hypothetical protein
MTLIDREGEVRTVVLPNMKKRTLQAIVKPLVDSDATIVTDSHLNRPRCPPKLAKRWKAC